MLQGVVRGHDVHGHSLCCLPGGSRLICVIYVPHFSCFCIFTDPAERVTTAGEDVSDVSDLLDLSDIYYLSVNDIPAQCVE